ncbi:hypothetical protein [Escherichia albertii]|uniref:hypothetical protein n=1 Tax=Escherichia albertii TaxID=208962 RepID=UPI0012FD1AC2|nr:hypothetical protein [Escherichia albertii]
MSANNMDLSAARSTYVIISVIFGCPFLGVLALLLFKGIVPGIFPILFASFLLMIGAILWVFMFRIKMENDMICYRSLFSGENCIHLSKIDSVVHKTGFEKYSDRFLPFIRLEVKERQGNTMIINLKIFNKNDIKLLKKYLDEGFIKNLRSTI